MKRSGGVSAAAIVLFFGSGLFVLMGAVMVFASSFAGASKESNPLGPGFFYMEAGFMLALAGWGIATAIGILQLRNWARISILVMSGLAIGMSVFTIFLSLVMVTTMNQTLHMPPGALVFAEIFEVILFGIPLGIAIWWMALFLRKSVIMQFQGAPQVAVVQPVDATGVVMTAIPEPPKNSVRGIPVSILVIAIYLLSTAPLSLVTFAFPFMRRMPLLLFGVIMRPGSMWKYTLVVVVLHLVLGLGLLWRKSWAHIATCLYCVFLIANAAAMMLRPGIAERLMAIMEQADPALAQMGGTLPPSFFRFELIGGAMFGIALPLAALYFLFTRRAAYRAACAAVKI